DGLDPQLVAGTMNAQRDLAAIGDQHLLEHAQYLMASSVSPHPSSAAPQTPSPACGGGLGWGMARIRRSLDQHQRRAVFDRRRVFDKNAREAARARRADLVHDLHRLD